MKTRLQQNTRRDWRYRVSGGGRRDQRGVGMLEVLIAVVILSFGLLGMAGLQISSLRVNQSAHMRTQAVSQAYNIVDQVRSDAVNVGAYDGVNVDLSQLFPSGQAAIAVNNPMITVTISWDDRAAGGQAAEQITVTTMLVAP